MRTWMYTLLIALSLSGCTNMPLGGGQLGEGKLLHRQQSAEPARRVDVGGLVSHPQAIKIPKSGLTLLQAVTRAGDIRAQNPTGLIDNSEDSPELLLLVSLQRASRVTRQTFYFPMSMVRQEAIAGVPLRDGDVVQVVTLAETRFADEAPKVRQPRFSVNGIGIRSRIFDLVGSNASRQFRDIPTADVAGNGVTTGGGTIAIIHRASQSGLIQEYFVFPQRLLFNQLGIMDIFPGDQVTFTTLERMPLVQSALLQSIQRGRPVPSDRRVRLRSLQQRQGSIPGLETLQNAGSNLMGAISRPLSNIFR